MFDMICQLHIGMTKRCQEVSDLSPGSRQYLPFLERTLLNVVTCEGRYESVPQDSDRLTREWLRDKSIVIFAVPCV